MTTHIRLSSGYDMPIVGMGLWKIPNADCADAVYDAIKLGYRLFDGAADYGNEVECGQGVARAIKEGLVKREDLFIVSKLWNTFHDKERVEPMCRRQLRDWGLDYFDLYVMHFPVALEYVDPSVRYPPGWHRDEAQTEIRPGRATIQETWQAMEALVLGPGLCRSIGVSNFQAQALYDVLRYARVRPATLQVERHPYLVQPDLVRAARAEGVAVTAYSSFGPAGFVELSMASAVSAVPLMRAAAVAEIAARHKRTPAQVLLRWSTQQGIAVIPKSSRRQLLAENLASTDFQLDEADIKAIDGLDKNMRFNQPSNYFPTDKLWIFG